MGFFFEITIALAAILLVLGYYFVSRKYSYWQRMGVKALKPKFPFGNFTGAFSQKIPISEQMTVIYNQSQDAFSGIYLFFRPALFIRDPELLRTVMIKDFNSFQDRGVHCDESYDPLSGHLFNIGGEKWKKLRAKLSPTFTTGKLKAMFSTFLDCSDSLTNYVGREAEAGRIIEMREVLAQYTTSAIASVGFGIDIDSIDNPGEPFRKFGRKIFEPSVKTNLRFLVQFLYPKLMSWLKIKSVDQDVEDFIMSMVRQNIEHREKNNVSRKDFFQLLLQLRNTGDVQVDGLWETKITKDENAKKLTVNECAAQTFVFYLAGFETSSTAMSFAMYELAKNVDLQRKVQLEIEQVLQRHNGNITYDSVAEMKYLDWVVDETLRKYPPVAMLNRVCNTPWTIPNTNTVVEVGTMLVIPAHSLHHDPKFYPEPEKFDPERFSPENSKSFVERPYMPFGEGPRNCVGMRLGLLQTKVGLMSMLQKYSFQLAGESLKPMVINKRSFVLAPVAGISLTATRRTN